jgi:hypothetical protein
MANDSANAAYTRTVGSLIWMRLSLPVQNGCVAFATTSVRGAPALLHQNVMGACVRHEPCHAMNIHVPKAITSILRLVREQRLDEATAEIQNILSGAR